MPSNQPIDNPGDAILLGAIVKACGNARFTLRDIHRRVYHALPGSWLPPDLAGRYRGELAGLIRHRHVERLPGPRHGEGYCVTHSGLSACPLQYRAWQTAQQEPPT